MLGSFPLTNVEAYLVKCASRASRPDFIFTFPESIIAQRYGQKVSAPVIILIKYGATDTTIDGLNTVALKSSIASISCLSSRLSLPQNQFKDGNLRARYLNIDALSFIIFPSTVMKGTYPLGLRARNSGDLCSFLRRSFNFSS